MIKRTTFLLSIILALVPVDVAAQGTPTPSPPAINAKAWILDGSQYRASAGATQS